MVAAPWAMPVTKRLKLPGGGELHYLEQGQGQPVLLLHGGMGDCFSWAPQIRALAADFRMISYSRYCSYPNRNPARQAQHPIIADVADLADFVNGLQLAPAHLVGTSYGAMLALLYARQCPERVLTLVLAEPPLHHWASRTPHGAALYKKFVASVWNPAARAFLQGEDSQAVQLLTDGIWESPRFDSWSVQRRNCALRNAGSMKMHTQAKAPFQVISRADAARINIPTLLVSGRNTSALHLCVIEELASVMPRACRVEIENAGHGAPSENPVSFNQSVREFILHPE